MKWFVLLHRGETAATAKPAYAISDEGVVRDVLRVVGKHLGLPSASRERPTARPIVVPLAKPGDDR